MKQYYAPLFVGFDFKQYSTKIGNVFNISMYDIALPNPICLQTSNNQKNVSF